MLPPFLKDATTGQTLPASRGYLLDVEWMFRKNRSRTLPRGRVLSGTCLERTCAVVHSINCADSFTARVDFDQVSRLSVGFQFAGIRAKLSLKLGGT